MCHRLQSRVPRMPRPGFHGSLELPAPLTTHTQTTPHKCQAMTSLSTLLIFCALATTSACRDTKVQHRSFGFQCTHLKGAAAAKWARPQEKDAERQTCWKNNSYHITHNSTGWKISLRPRQEILNTPLRGKHQELASNYTWCPPSQGSGPRPSASCCQSTSLSTCLTHAGSASR